MHLRNHIEVWKALRSKAPISLSELTNLVPLSRVTISTIIKEMLQQGLVQSMGFADSTGGRPSALLSYVPTARLAVGVTMFDNEIISVLADLDGQAVKFHRRAWQGTSPESLLTAMAAAVQDLIIDVDRRRLLGVGVGLPGLIDVPSGRLLLCISMGWLGKPVEARHILEQALDLPVFIANRSRMAALGELQTGVGRGLDSLLYMYLGKGVVAGIALADGIYFGASSSAGEIGHTTVVPDGPLCSCGNRGCLELYTSESSIVARAIAKAREEPQSTLRKETHGNLQALTLDTVIRCAEQGDPAAIATFADVSSYLGIALSMALNLLNPQMLVLGGPVGSRAGALLLEPTIREIEKRTLPLTLAGTQIVTGSPDQEFAALGAASLVLTSVPVEQFLMVGDEWSLSEADTTSWDKSATFSAKTV